MTCSWSGSSLVLALLIAIPVGVLQAVQRNKVADYAATGISFLLYSMPSYLLGLLLIAVFAVKLQAAARRGAAGAHDHRGAGRPGGLVLPIATLTLVTCALFSRYMRSSAIDSLAQDYIRTARAKGLAASCRPVPAPAAQLADPGRHAGRDLAARHPDLRPDRRAALQLPGDRAGVLQRRGERRLPGGVRRHRPGGAGRPCSATCSPTSRTRCSTRGCAMTDPGARRGPLLSPRLAPGAPRAARRSARTPPGG